MAEVNAGVTDTEHITGDICCGIEVAIDLQNATPEIVIDIAATGPQGAAGVNGKDGETTESLTNLEIEALINSFV